MVQKPLFYVFCTQKEGPVSYCITQYLWRFAVFFLSIMHKCIWISVFVPICVHFPSTEGNEKMARNTYFWGLFWRVNVAKIWSLCIWFYSNLFFTVDHNLFECSWAWTGSKTIFSCILYRKRKPSCILLHTAIPMKACSVFLHIMHNCK